MKKIAIFTEGQSEQIFIRCFLGVKLGWERISFKCFRLHRNQMEQAPFEHPNENAETYFLIVNVGNDASVLSAIKEREKMLVQKGYEKIIALRDMYSKAYCDRAGSTINNAITQEFVIGFQETIQKMSCPDRIKMHFAIMELEAWFLGMYDIFKKINSALTIDYINQNLGFTLNLIDPQDSFFKPTNAMNRIYNLVGMRYRKSEHDIESLCSKMDISDFSNALENGRCASFKDFCDEILNLV